MGYRKVIKGIRIQPAKDNERLCPGISYCRLNFFKTKVVVNGSTLTLNLTYLFSSGTHVGRDYESHRYGISEYRDDKSDWLLWDKSVRVFTGKDLFVSSRRQSTSKMFTEVVSPWRNQSPIKLRTVGVWLGRPTVSLLYVRRNLCFSVPRGRD